MVPEGVNRGNRERGDAIHGRHWKTKVTKISFSLIELACQLAQFWIAALPPILESSRLVVKFAKEALDSVFNPLLLRDYILSQLLNITTIFLRVLSSKMELGFYTLYPSGNVPGFYGTYSIYLLHIAPLGVKGICYPVGRQR